MRAGTAFQFVVMRLLGAVVGGTLGLLAMYITYGANGSSYMASTTKAGCRGISGCVEFVSCCQQ